MIARSKNIVAALPATEMNAEALCRSAHESKRDHFALLRYPNFAVILAAVILVQDNNLPLYSIY
jgi:hypothetical protein